MAGAELVVVWDRGGGPTQIKNAGEEGASISMAAGGGRTKLVIVKGIKNAGEGGALISMAAGKGGTKLVIVREVRIQIKNAGGGGASVLTTRGEGRTKLVVVGSGCEPK
ncbi:hypothetical protein TIFTF001_005427 [Ficus carica]|uniref:Uncharacterized protein n=1 Tax=Ficus carica TaxID=3494 RepID=A0AA87ZY81_FICCA|nr:hypothetical protein TIFTF001_005427 [Ficus carica]